LTVEDVPDSPPNRPMVMGTDSRAVNLSWAPPRKVHNHPVTAYKIFIKEGEHGLWNRTVETRSNRTFQYIDGLNPYTVYLFRVAAENALGYSNPGKESYPTLTLRERPSGRPKFIRERLSTSSTSLSLVWAPPPQFTINAEFRGYQLTYKPSNYIMANTTAIQINVRDSISVQNFTLRNLEKHTKYQVTVAARNYVGLGPSDVIQLRTEDGVPLEPLSPRIRNVTSRWIELTWQPPSNADGLGNDLLGYRVYVEELCDHLTIVSSSKKRNRIMPTWIGSSGSGGRGSGGQFEAEAAASASNGFGGTILKRGRSSGSSECRTIPPETVHGASVTLANFENLAPYTKYRFMIRAFTKRREGPASENLVVITDTEAPSPPRVTNITCYGVNELLVEWRRPEVTFDHVKFYRIYLTSLDGHRSNQELTVDVMNETLRYVAYLTNLTTNSRYDLSVAAFVESHLKPGTFYKSPNSPSRRVYVDLECDPHQAFSKVPYEIFEYNAGIMVGIIATVSILVSIILLLLVCKKHRPSYETIALTPRKYWSGGGTGHTSGSGWLGDPETNIPALLFPKHVLGLHASDDLAFHRDFEVVHSSSRRLTMNNGSTTLNNGTYPPDILNGGRDLVNYHAPIFMDGWNSNNGEYIALLAEAPFALESTWKLIWDQKVSFVVTILTSVSKDDLGTLSNAKTFGDHDVGLYNEDILPDYTIRTLKLTKKKARKTERIVTQLLFSRWPEVGLPLGADFLHFVKSVFACRQSSLVGGKLLLQSRIGLDPCLLFATFETMLSQLRSTGEINISSFSKHLSSRHDLALSSVDQYVYLHDTVAAAIECGHLHGVIQIRNGTLTHNGTTASVDRMSEFSAHVV